MLVVDEIRTMCRVGSSLSGGQWSELVDVHEREAMAPDMYTMCKAFANGVQPYSCL
jgi:adenosylmethionine-8-amino-7-oxononanoate aminotransferase